MKVYQVYFREEQLPALDYTPYYNKDCTLFFENSVICDLINQGAHKRDNYFGVVSHQLRQKVAIGKTNWAAIKNIANTSVTEFTPENFEIGLLKGKPDAMSFQRHIPHDPISFADQFHPNFSIYFARLMKRIGYNWNGEKLPDVFYCNYFVAKSDIYERYVKEMLIPFMEAMKFMPELMNDSKYPKPLPEELKKKFGIAHYPYHPFLCERLFSYFAYKNNLKCLHY